MKGKEDIALSLDFISKYGGNHETRLLRPTELFASLNEWPELWDSVHTLQFTGGEPIINEEHYDLLNGIPENRKHKIKLRYATNISYLKFKKHNLIEIWSKFKHTNIKVSMDGIEGVYNFIRQDGDWDNVYANMLVLNAEPTIDVAAGITIQAHNIFHLPEFYTFWKNSDVDLRFITANILQTPRYLAPSVWPAEYREAIISKLKSALNEHPEMQKFITYMENNQPNIRDYAKMRKYNRDLEERYPKDITLKSMVNDHLGMQPEDMKLVHKRLMNEER